MANAENVIDVSEATFDEDVIERSHEVPVVVDFWAPWCGPCRMLSPILEKLAADPNHNFILAKVNANLNPSLSMIYNVQGIPAVKAFRYGEIVAEFVGAQAEPSVRKFIQKVAPSETDYALQEAHSLLVTRHWAEAEEAYRDILAHRPDQPIATINLARTLLAQGEGCEAIHYLEHIHDGPEMLQAQRLMPLARYLCDYEVRWDDDPEEIKPLEAQYRRAAHLLARHNLEAAMDGLIDILRQDKRYRKGAPKEVLLGIFELLGDNDDLTQNYRRELATVLF